MAPGAAKGDLLYISSYANGEVLVYSYPQGKLVGTLTGFYGPDGICVDKRGDIWIVNNNAAGVVGVVEYKHGGTSPIATLVDPGYFPVNCSIDPTTGNLALSNLETYYPYKQGNAAIYAHAQGMPKLYRDSKLFQVYFSGYDNKGDLYVDGTPSPSFGFQFAELPKGNKTFTNITLKGGTIYFPGKVLWDGKYVTVGDQTYQNKSPETSGIYQTTGSGGKIVGTTPLKGSSDVVGFWIQGNTVIAPDIGLLDVRFYRYPAGGKSTKVLPHCEGTPGCDAYGAAVSLAK
jgi:hypothetical protein